jgi:predicted  nucleic acid-binding Zn-ribbon protein
MMTKEHQIRTEIRRLENIIEDSKNKIRSLQYELEDIRKPLPKNTRQHGGTVIVRKKNG